MKKIVTVLLTFTIHFFCFAQKDYTDYYNITYNYHLNDINPEKKINAENVENLYLKAFSVNKALVYDLFSLAYDFYSEGNLKKGNAYLLKAASSGFEIS